MSESAYFWKNPEYHDFTLLLGSNMQMLEQELASLREHLNARAGRKTKRKADPADQTAQLSKRTKSTSSSEAPAVPSTTASGQVLKIPVHRITLCTGSQYFKTAFATLLGDRNSTAHPVHPIMVIHEENTEAAEGVLQYLYTKAIDPSFCTARQLMNLLLVSTVLTSHHFAVHGGHGVFW